METSYILARIFGICLIVLYGGLLLNQHYIMRVFKEVTDSAFAIFLTGFIALVLGITLIQIHNIWTPDWRGFITLFSWIIFLNGFIRLVFPGLVVRFAQKIMERNNFFFVKVASVISCLIGLYLTYIGFFSSNLG